MSAAKFVPAQTASGPLGHGTTAVAESDLPTIAQYMFALMLRNIASDGFVVADPSSPGRFSSPGCVIATASCPADLSSFTQDYVYNWVRDAALTAMELVTANLPPDTLGRGHRALKDYVNFAETCQDNATPTLSHACFTVEGQSLQWSKQSDGPALQTVAMLQAFDQLNTATQAPAAAVINKEVGYLLTGYQDPTSNLREEQQGLSFFARSAQLGCFEAITSNTHGISAPPRTAEAVTWLQEALQAHWNGTYCVTLPNPPSPGQARSPTVPANEGHDPNIDIVMAAVYGAVPHTDTKLFATGARLRHQWAHTGSSGVYAINTADATQGLGPLLGRYPGDTHDGDNSDSSGGHPWALCRCNVAELYCGLANEIAGGTPAPFDDLSAPFLSPIGVTSTTSPAVLLRAVVYHSDNPELTEQFEGTSGYEKSVRDLTCSHGAFLSAVRANTGQGVQG
jgi:glucoamylase